MLIHWKKLCCLLLCLCCCLPALAEGGDGLIPLTEDELLDRMAAPAPEGEEDASAFLVLPEDLPMMDTDVFTLLLIGTDAYDDDQRGRSDAIILVRLDAARKTIRMVSFLRDLYVKIPGRGSNRINASYAWGGPELLKKTLEANFGVTVDAYAEVNFERLTKVIDAIGGVTVEVSEAERKQLNSILRFYNTHTGSPEEDQLLPESGEQLLTGKQALCYSRIRKIDSDFQRASRQRKVIEAAFHRVMSLDRLSLITLALHNMDAVTTDLSAEDVVKLAPLALRSKNAAFSSMQVPAEGAYTNQTVSGMAVLVPNLKKNRQRLEAFLSAP